MKKKLKILIIVIFFLSKASYSQETFTLDECVAYALEHNLQLNDSKYEIDSSRETYRQSFRELLPSVRATSEYNIRYGRSINPNDNSFVNTEFFSNNYALEASLNLFKGFQKINAIKMSKFIYNATVEEIKQQKYLLAFRVMQAFYNIQFLEGALAIAMEQVDISKANYDLVDKRIELGILAGADLYEAESLLLTDSLDAIQANNQLIAAKLILIQEMNLEGTSDVNIINEVQNNIQILEVNELISDTVYNKAQNFIPIIKSGKLRVEAAKKKVAVARGNLYPSLFLFGGYGTGYYETITDGSGGIVPFNQQFNDNAFRVVGLSLNIPISDGWSGRSHVKQHKIKSLRAENDLKVHEQELYKTIQTLVQEARSLRIEYAQTSKNVESQKQAFAVAQKRYENGLISALELYTSKNLFATAQNQNLQVRLKSEINKSTLEFYQGLPIFNIDKN